MSSSASAFAKTLPQSLSSRTVLVKCTPTPRSLAERRAILKGLLMTGQRPEIEVFRKLDDDSSFIAVAATAATATCLVDDSPFRRLMVTAPAQAGATAQATAAWGSAAAAAGTAGSSSAAAAAAAATDAAPLAEPVVVQVLKKNEKTKDPSKRPLWWRKREEKRMKEAAERQAAAEKLAAEQQQKDLESGDAAAATAGKSGAEESLSIQKKEFTIHVFPANKGFNHQRMLGRGLLHGPWPLNINTFLASGDGHQDQAELRDTFISAALRKSVPPGRLAPSLKDWDTGRQMAIGRGTATGFDDRAAWELLGVGVHGASFIQHRLHQKDIASKTPAVMHSLAAMSRQGLHRQRWNSYGRDEEEGRETGFGQGEDMG
ncbi:hypothetical protein PG993_001859 [Apiospora rasikravindrae]|uniref:Uncharacterized protein n=1 Tax=Apiospora rasikravindrae TaxID=990691 RepID=A0ABR1UD75_9PEZI